jgi:hypothetical protein
MNCVQNVQTVQPQPEANQPLAELLHAPFNSPISFLPRVARLCRNARIPHTCHLERSERSCIFSYMRRKDFSPLARNDNCDTVSAGEDHGGGLDDLNFWNNWNDTVS